MLLKKEEKEYKYALKLQREMNSIYKKIYSIKAIKLDAPIQHGYVRYLELRDEVKRRPDYLKILETFNLCGQKRVYSDKKSFLVKTKKGYSEIHAYVKSIRDPRFGFYYREAKRSEDIAKIEECKKFLGYHCGIYSCFDCDISNNEQIMNRNHFYPHYVFKFPWMVEEKTKVHYLTHYTPVDAELESRLSEIRNTMTANCYWKHFTKRNVSEKIDWENRTNIKYNKGIIYHTLDFE